MTTTNTCKRCHYTANTSWYVVDGYCMECASDNYEQIHIAKSHSLHFEINGNVPFVEGASEEDLKVMRKHQLNWYNKLIREDASSQEIVRYVSVMSLGN